MPIDKNIRHKVGDHVILHPDQVDIHPFKHNEVYVVDRAVVEHVYLSSLEGKKLGGGRYHWRFVPAILDRAIQPGDHVVFDMDCPLNKDKAAFKGMVFAVKSGKTWLTLEGGENRYHVKRFKLHVAKKPGEKKEEVKKPDPKPDLREILTEVVKLKGQISICSYGTMFEDGFVNKQVNDVCHARLTYIHNGKPLKEAALILCGSEQFLSERYNKEHVPRYMEVYREYIRYLLNESPWSVAFLTKDVQEAFEKGVLLNLDVHRNWAAGAAVATREGVEFVERLPVFKRVREMGFNGNVAYLCSMYLIGSFKNPGEYSKGNCGGGHRVLNGCLPWDALCSFMAHGYKPQAHLKPFREEQGNYHIATACVDGYVNLEGQDRYYYQAKVDNQMKTICHNNCPVVVVGNGFNKKETINDDGLKALATFIDKELKGAKQ